MKPLFMWAGGKNKMIKNYLPYLPKTIETYAEPFFGGGAMFIYIQKNYKPKQNYICDKNEIINIYECIKNNVGEFCEILSYYESEYLKRNKEERKKFYYDIRNQNGYEYEKWTFVEQTAVLYFLMKTSFNGIWQINKNTNNRYGTPVGLCNQTSLFDYENIMEWHNALQNTTIIRGDWKDCPIGDFTFIDPPYRNSFTSYGLEWTDKDFEDILEKMKGKVFICNRGDDTDYYETIKGDLKIVEFPIVYTAGRRKRTENGYKAKNATEILLYR